MKGKKALIVLAIITLSGIASLLMYFVLELPLKKSLFIPFGAGAAMILFDLIVPELTKNKKSSSLRS